MRAGRQGIDAMSALRPLSKTPADEHDFRLADQDLSGTAAMGPKQT
jgi:hypothetical protein